MPQKILPRPRFLHLLSVIILVMGLGGAALIYQRAGNTPYGVVSYETADGTIYPISPQDSKMYRHNLEVYGGKFNVMLDDFRRWFVGLWHGRSLAVIIAGTSLIISGGLFYAAHDAARPEPAEVHHEDNPEGTG
jgi:hypothetical protein